MTWKDTIKRTSPTKSKSFHLHPKENGKGLKIKNVIFNATALYTLDSKGLVTEREEPEPKPQLKPPPRPFIFKPKEKITLKEKLEAKPETEEDLDKKMTEPLPLPKFRKFLHRKAMDAIKKGKLIRKVDSTLVKCKNLMNSEPNISSEMHTKTNIENSELMLLETLPTPKHNVNMEEILSPDILENLELSSPIKENLEELHSSSSTNLSLLSNFEATIKVSKLSQPKENPEEELKITKTTFPEQIYCLDDFTDLEFPEKIPKISSENIKTLYDSSKFKSSNILLTAQELCKLEHSFVYETTNSEKIKDVQVEEDDFNISEPHLDEFREQVQETNTEHYSKICLSNSNIEDYTNDKEFSVSYISRSEISSENFSDSESCQNESVTKKEINNTSLNISTTSSWELLQSNLRTKCMPAVEQKKIILDLVSTESLYETNSETSSCKEIYALNLKQNLKEIKKRKTIFSKEFEEKEKHQSLVG